tara:strand:- start:331 stop:1407 length:1077 start_codon:yes stop_codon:yes gene_type:complete
MSYLGRKGSPAPLVSSDIPDNSITGAKIVDATIAAGDLASDVVINTSGSITTTGGMTVDGDTVFNEAQEDVDFRVESNNNANMLVVDASADKVGIGTATPAKHLEVSSAIPTFRLNSTEGNAGSTDILGEISWKSADTHRGGDPAAAIRAIVGGTTGEKTDLIFMTGENGSAASEKMRINESGKIGIGTQVPNAYLDIKKNYADLRLGYGTGNTEHREIYFHDSNLQLYFWNGSNEAYLTSGGVWTDASDERLKKDIKDIEYGLAEILKCKPRKYKLKADNLEQIGFVAQEMLSIIPEVISGGESDDDRPDHLKLFDNGKSQYGLHYGALTAVAFKAIQELSAKNDALEARIEALENA